MPTTPADGLGVLPGRSSTPTTLGDPDHLIAVTKGANRSKGAKGPEEWRPPDEGYWCQYATDWAEVKMEWGLTMTQRETEAVIVMLDSCEEPVDVKAKRAEGIAGTDTSGQAAAGEATATPTLVPELEPVESTPVYGSCEEAVEAGESRVQGSPDSPPDMVGSCLVCFQGVSGCRPGVTHDMIGHRTGSRVPSLGVSAAVRCQLWLFSGQRRHGRAWQLGRVAYKPMLQAGSPMLDTARQPAPISSAAP